MHEQNSVNGYPLANAMADSDLFWLHRPAAIVALLQQTKLYKAF
jgi:hypothetical protein